MLKMAIRKKCKAYNDMLIRSILKEDFIMEERNMNNQENQELENNQNQKNGKPETPAEEKKDGFFKKAVRGVKKAATSKIACTVYGILGGTLVMGAIGHFFGKDDAFLPSGGAGTVPMIPEKTVPELVDQVSEAVTEATEK